MRAILAIIVAMMLFAVACTTQQTSDAAPIAPSVPVADVKEPQAAADTPPSNTAQANTDVVKPESGVDKAFGEVEKASALKVDDVLCDKEAKKITFRFKNDDTKSWQLNQEVPFPPPSDLASLRVFINSYEANNANGYIKDGVRYFGPAQKFSDNCGGVEVLKPGEDVTCTLVPVSLKSANAYSAGKNNIFVETPTSKHIIEFLCE